jgi:hypothetical protein
MKKIALALAATMALGTILPTAAEARHYGRHGYGHHAYYGGHRGYRRHRGNPAAGAAVVGIAGALIGGAAIAAANRNRHHYYYDEPAYGYPAYGGGSYYDY